MLKQRKTTNTNIEKEEKETTESPKKTTKTLTQTKKTSCLSRCFQFFFYLLLAIITLSMASFVITGSWTFGLPLSTLYRAQRAMNTVISLKISIHAKTFCFNTF